MVFVDLCYRIGEKYKIISDKRIKSTHLGEAKTMDFFKKELWRGKSNLKGVKEDGLKLKDVPSVVLPLYYLMLPLVFLILLLYVNNNAILALLYLIVLLITPPPLFSAYFTIRTNRYNQILKASIIYLVYFTARALSLIR